MQHFSVIATELQEQSGEIHPAFGFREHFTEEVTFERLIRVD